VTGTDSGKTGTATLTITLVPRTDPVQSLPVSPAPRGSAAQIPSRSPAPRAQSLRQLGSVSPALMGTAAHQWSSEDIRAAGVDGLGPDGAIFRHAIGLILLILGPNA
jgi:hypothetical protein